MRSLLCGPGSERLPGRIPEVVCRRGASCSSLHLLPVSSRPLFPREVVRLHLVGAVVEHLRESQLHRRAHMSLPCTQAALSSAQHRTTAAITIHHYRQDSKQRHQCSPVWTKRLVVVVLRRTPVRVPSDVAGFLASSASIPSSLSTTTHHSGAERRRIPLLEDRGREVIRPLEKMVVAR